MHAFKLHRYCVVYVCPDGRRQHPLASESVVSVGQCPIPHQGDDDPALLSPEISREREI